MRGFGGLKVVAFESRQAEAMAQLITKNGGHPVIAPALKEVPLEENSEALTFAEKLFSGEIDILILMTGVGLRTLTEAIETRYPKGKFLEALQKIQLVARGPKPTAVLNHFGIRDFLKVPEPNTWREVLTTLDSQCPVGGKRVAVQEYGVSNQAFLDALTQREASVLRVPVYRWALPEDTSPLKNALQMIADGGADVLLFTNAAQVTHLIKVAQESTLEQAFRKALPKLVIASIGPTSSETLTAQGFEVDLEPTHPKMGILVKETAEQSQALIQKKRPSTGNGPVAVAVASTSETLKNPLRESLFMKACRLEPTETTPVWFMRQIGRYMAEYQEVRAKTSFLELCKNTDLSSEVTIMAVKRLGVDAAVIFADILLIIEPMGIGLEFRKGDGPVILNPIRSGKAVEKLLEVNPEETLPFVLEMIGKCRSGLPSDIPLIGFSGAPFTLACYLIEGGASKDYAHTKTLMRIDPGAFHALMKHLARAVTRYLNSQVTAGVQALQLFDTWVGCLNPAEYREFVLPHNREIFQGLPKDVPAIHFGVGTAELLDLMKEAGGQIIGLDWRVDLGETWNRLGPNIGVQGNQDPNSLFGDQESIRSTARRILEGASGRPGHIFNLGHGILPKTPVDNVIALVDAVHEFKGNN